MSKYKIKEYKVASIHLAEGDYNEEDIKLLLKHLKTMNSTVEELTEKTIRRLANMDKNTKLVSHKDMFNK